MLLLIYNYQIGLLCSHLLHSSTLLLTSYEWDVNLHVHSFYFFGNRNYLFASLYCTEYEPAQHWFSSHYLESLELSHREANNLHKAIGKE